MPHSSHSQTQIVVSDIDCKSIEETPGRGVHRCLNWCDCFASRRSSKIFISFIILNEKEKDRCSLSFCTPTQYSSGNLSTTPFDASTPSFLRTEKLSSTNRSCVPTFRTLLQSNPSNSPQLDALDKTNKTNHNLKRTPRKMKKTRWNATVKPKVCKITKRRVRKSRPRTIRLSNTSTTLLQTSFIQSLSTPSISPRSGTKSSLLRTTTRKSKATRSPSRPSLKNS